MDTTHGLAAKGALLRMRAEIFFTTSEAGRFFTGRHYPLWTNASSDALFGSGHRSRREQSEIVMNAPAVGPHLGAATRNLQNQAEQVPAGLLDGGFAGGDAAGVGIDQVLPAALEFGLG